MMEKRNLFWGVGFIAVAVFLIVSRLVDLGGISFWSIFLTGAFGMMLFEGIRDKSFGAILFSVAFLCIVWDKQLGITMLTPWPVLGAALFGTIGCNLIFDNKKHYHANYSGTSDAYHEPQGNVEFDNGESMVCQTRFGAVTKYANSTNLREVMIDVSFGSAIVYLDKAQVQGDTVYVHVNSSFGGIKLYVPQTWYVEGHVKSTFAGVDYKKGIPNGENRVKVILDGTASFSGIEVFYI